MNSQFELLLLWKIPLFISAILLSPVVTTVILPTWSSIFGNCRQRYRSQNFDKYSPNLSKFACWPFDSWCQIRTNSSLVNATPLALSCGQFRFKILLLETQDQQLEMQQLPREETLRTPVVASHTAHSSGEPIWRTHMARRDEKKDATTTRGTLDTRKAHARCSHENLTFTGEFIRHLVHFDRSCIQRCSWTDPRTGDRPSVHQRMM